MLAVDATSLPMGALALVGARSEAEERDLDGMLGEIYAERERDAGRAVDLGDRCTYLIRTF